jgi:ACS family pantothenate transporter-like MFS transporter
LRLSATDVRFSKPLEIAKRTAIFTAIGQIGSMFAGIMMTAMNEGLHNQTSLQGWQWVFIISITTYLVIDSG